MANKKTLDQLIVEVLEEKKINLKIPGLQKKDKKWVNTTTPNFQKPFGSNVNKITGPDFENLSAEDGDADNFTPSDLYNAFREKSDQQVYKDADKFNAANKAYRDTAIRAKELAKRSIPPESVEDIDAFDPKTPTQKVTADEIKSMAFKKLQTISADPADEKINLGKFPEGLSTAVDVVFAGDDTFTKRIQKISELTALIYKPKYGGYKANAQEIQNQYPSQSDLLATILVLDYVTTVVKEIDAGAAAYEFESLLALLAGGRVTGKQLVGSSMGATDFVTNKGVKGSAKYYGKANYKAIKQAAKGFEKDVPYIYIVAHKKGSSKSSALSTGESDPREVKSIDIYLFSMVTPNNKDFIIRNANGELVYRQAGTSYVYLGGGEVMVKPITLYVEKATKQAKSFRQQLLDNIAKNLTQDHKDALGAYELISRNAYIADEKMKAFMSTGEDYTGNEALSAMMKMEQGVEKLVPIFSKGGRYKHQIKKGISENKNKSIKDLDKLIEQVILKHINK